MPRRVERTRASGTWTEARYFGFIRSALRSAFQKYPVKYHAKRQAMVEGGYECASCSGVFKSGEVHVDHIEPCGSLKTYEDLPAFVERMFCEVDGFQVLCKPCHQDKTNAERAARKKT